MRWAMGIRMNILLFIGAIGSSALASAAVDSVGKERMRETLDIIRNTFLVQYAPVDWKRKVAGWELEGEIEKAKAKVDALENPTVKEFQGIVRDFFASTRDYHVGVNFYSTERATLPFRVKGVKGKYFITSIDRTKLSPFHFPFQIGDELVKFDGKATHDAVTELKEREVGSASELTDYAMAELCLTSRSGQAGHFVPKGPVTIAVKSPGREQAASYQLIWNYSPEMIRSNALSCKGMAPSCAKSCLKRLTEKNLLLPYYRTMREGKSAAEEEGGEEEPLGARVSFLPSLGKKWWESDPESPFHAYLYEGSDRRLIGYIRIPHYIGGEEEAEEFGRIIERMEEAADALVIDQIYNPGGSLFYLYALLSMLTDQPLSAPRHRMTITQKEVMDAVYCIPLFEQIGGDEEAKAVLGETLDGNPVTYQMAQFFLNYFRFIVEEWNEGRRLTTPFYLYGIDQINPHPRVRYTKPLLVLSSSLNFSGGEFFPAILQDAKRALNMGERTAGAGGFVLSSSFPNHFGIAGYHYTASIAERADKNPIENLGVEPDIPYSVTERDLRGNYIDFLGEIERVINGMLSNKRLDQ